LEKIFIMSEKELTIYDLVQKVKDKRLSQMKASELLNISDRHFRRLWQAYKKHGPKALISKKRGQPSNNRLSEKLFEKSIELIQKYYDGFGPTLANEKLLENHGIKISIETLRKWMIRADLWNNKKRKKLKLHQSRLRRSCRGELIQVDGSPHAWFESRGAKCCLLGFIDDATSKVMHLQFVVSESTESYFKAMIQYLIKNGKPLSFYTDRLNVFKVNNDKAGYRKSGPQSQGKFPT